MTRDITFRIGKQKLIITDDKGGSYEINSPSEVSFVYFDHKVVLGISYLLEKNISPESMGQLSAFARELGQKPRIGSVDDDRLPNHRNYWRIDLEDVNINLIHKNS